MNREKRVSLAAYACLYPNAVEPGGVTVLPRRLSEVSVRANWLRSARATRTP